jgi:hypothetical protein
MEKIDLNWSSAGTLNDFINDTSQKYLNINKPGLYMHVMRYDGFLCVVYLGKADHILNRQVEHAASVQRGRGSIIKKPVDDTHGPDIVYVPDYDSDFKEHEIDKNFTLQETNILYAPVDTKVHNLMGLEGALLIHLWRHADTRKYLITRISTYQLRNYRINNIFEKNPNQILGFNGARSVVQTP